MIGGLRIWPHVGAVVGAQDPTVRVEPSLRPLATSMVKRYYRHQPRS